ncbi:MAG: hypothetical protein L3J76_00670, partial [Candidatus Hydrothermae bacterium]|nr:hypothetical protein [Candidatus Hydrothermae bacterium]
GGFSSALYAFLLDCVLEPDRETLARVMEDEPALVGVLGGELLKHLGGVAVKNSRTRESA